MPGRCYCLLEFFTSDDREVDKPLFHIIENNKNNATHPDFENATDVKKFSRDDRKKRMAGRED